MNVPCLTEAWFCEGQSRSRGGASLFPMATMWGLIEICFSDARKMEELLATPGTRRRIGPALESLGVWALAARGASPAAMLADRLLLELFPLARRVHVGGEAGVGEQHDEPRDGKQERRRGRRGASKLEAA
jgi:hypothetical protein